MGELSLHLFLDGLASGFLRRDVGKIVESDVIEIRQGDLAADSREEVTPIHLLFQLPANLQQGLLITTHNRLQVLIVCEGELILLVPA